ncbi:MAG: oligosaccharide flippase family protein [Bacilli bacterium]|nr:oligosaccharide flippase family protein [Bacilli bacterium]
MKYLDRFIFNNDKSIKSQSVIWNIVASLLNAIISAYLLLIVTRFIGVKVGGIFVIASTLAYQMLTIGNYGMRNYQATDTLKKFSFSEYLSSRFITSILMIIASFIIIIYNGYTINKALIILFFILFKWVDAIEDVYHGFYQQNNRLDVACRAQSIRYIVSLIFFTVVIIITKDLLISCITSFVFSFIFFVWINKYIKKRFSFKKKTKHKNVLQLLYECFPLFISSYLYLYICNSPKYSIDKVLSDSFQTYFGIIFMPVFVINLISTLIYRPLLTGLAETWNSGKYKEMIKSIVKQISIIGVITVMAVGFAYFFGTQVLGLIYGVDISKYKLHLSLLMIGGGLNAIVGYLLSIVTIVRAQKLVIFGYGVVAGISVLISKMLVVKYKLLGAAILYDVLILLLGVYFIVLVIIFYKKNVKKV